MGKLINWAVLIGIGYFLYTYLGTGDITLIQPTKNEVVEVANKNKVNNNIGPNQRLAAGEKCKRIGGGWLKQGIYSCEVLVFEGRGMAGTPKATYELVLEKKNSQWQVKPQ